MQGMIAINWPLFISTDLLSSLTIVRMVKMCGNEGKVTNKRFDANCMGKLVCKGPALFKYFLAIQIPSFYLEVNLMPYGFLFGIIPIE